MTAAAEFAWQGRMPIRPYSQRLASRIALFLDVFRLTDFCIYAKVLKKQQFFIF